jgi:hypothetical protein
MKSLSLHAINESSPYEVSAVYDGCYLRLCIEQLMKEALENSKPLEKQKEDFGKYLKAKGFPSEIRTQALNTLDSYTKYQNNNVKHNFKDEYAEMDFVFSMGESLIKVLK